MLPCTSEVMLNMWGCPGLCNKGVYEVKKKLFQVISLAQTPVTKLLNVAFRQYKLSFYIHSE